MARNVFDWVFRTAMLVFAGLVTLSILGAIAAIPSGGGPAGFGGERPRPVPVELAEPTPSPPGQRPAAAAREAAAERQSLGPSGVVSAIAPAAPPKVEEWLESITYALLALLGLAAIGLLLLWQALVQLRRIADAAESALFSARPRP